MDYKKRYDKWNLYGNLNDEMRAELDLIANDEHEIKEHFGDEINFGTGGLRGIMGVGSNRINIYTIRKATQGFANYLSNAYSNIDKSVAIAYDSRNNSKLFAQQAGCVLAANGIKAYVFETLKPTPMLSYAVRELNCQGGIVVTASHNPPKYNGYKVYGEDGCQVALDRANSIIDEIQKVDIFDDVKSSELDKMIDKGMFEYIPNELDEKYYNDVIALVKNDNISREDMKIVYTPIHGTGAIPVTQVLNRIGYKDVNVVESQREPNGDFPTVSYPNPEEKEALQLAIDLANKINADLVLATDPDADRVGIATRDNQGNLRLINGNQIGVLLIEYIYSQKLYKKWNNVNFDISYGVVIKTVVTSDLGANIAKSYGARVMETLTGFKYIGGKINEIESHKTGKFIFGYEESHGYLAGTFVRDKDAVISSALIAEMFTYYKSKNMTLFDALEQIYKKHGYYRDKLISMRFEGLEGKEKILNIMKMFGEIDVVKDKFKNVQIIENYNLSKRYIIDHSSDGKESIESIELPKSNVIKCFFDDGSWFAIRPSGTEPKIKIYISANANTQGECDNRINELSEYISQFLQ